VLKRKKSTVFLLVILVLAVAGTLTVEAQPPTPQGYVSDFAGVCSVDQLQTLENQLVSIEAETTVEIAVVTLDDCGEDPFELRVEIFNQWGVGKADIDNGLLILSCVSQRELQQEVGYGLEGVLPDLRTSKAADEYFVPQAQAGNICQGLIDLTAYYKTLLVKEDEVKSNEEKDNTAGIIAFGVIFGIWLFGGVAIAVLVGPDAAVDWWIMWLRFGAILLSSSSKGGHKFGGGRSGGGGSRTRL